MLISPELLLLQVRSVTIPLAKISSGSKIIKEVSLTQPLASISWTVYVPGPKPVILVAFPPGGIKLVFVDDHVQSNCGDPPEAEKRIVPLSSPKQTTSV